MVGCKDLMFSGEGVEEKRRAILPFLDPIIIHPFPTVIYLSLSSDANDVYTCLVFVFFTVFTVDIPCVLFVFIYDYWFKIGGGECKIYSTLNTCGSASAFNKNLRLSLRGRVKKK